MTYYTQADLDAAVKEAEERVRHSFLSELALEAYQVAVSKGWEEDADQRTFGDECALLHEEITEAWKAWRKHGFDSWVTEDGKPEGVGSEFADEFIRLLHYCYTRNVDLWFEYQRKTAYNKTRSYRHGEQRR